MTTIAYARRTNGGAPARRAVVRWGIRLFRREWRQQLLITALLAVATAATVVGLAVATNVPPTSRTTFVLSKNDTQVDADIAAIQSRFGPAVVYAHHKVAVPGTVASIDLRAAVSSGTATTSSLHLRQGHLPTSAGEVAVTRDVAASFGLHVGDKWSELGSNLTVVGIVEDPRDLGDNFALVAPAQLPAVDNVTVRIDKNVGRSQLESFRLPSRSGIQTIGESSAAKTQTDIAVLALGTLVLLFVGLVGVAGFSVMAHRRERSLGMLGSIGATDAHVRLVVLANGAAVGGVAALVGGTVGIVTWLVLAPHLESAAGHRIDRFDLPWWAIGAAAVLAVTTSIASAWWPARAAARTSIVTALSARPPRPRAATRSALLGLIVLGAGITLIFFAHQDRALLVLTGTVATVIGVLLLGPLTIRAVASLASRLPIAPRLALRDLARYQARSGAALGAATLAVGIAAIITVSAAAQITKESANGVNLPANELVVYTSPAQHDKGGPLDELSDSQLASVRGQADAIAAAVGAHGAIELDLAINPVAGLVGNPNGPAGRPPAALVAITPQSGGGQFIELKALLYVATPDVLAQYGIAPSSIDPATDILSSRSDLGGLQLSFLDRQAISNPRIQHVNLPRGTSEPNALITMSAVERLGLKPVPAAWLIRASSPLTAAQINDARKAAAASGLTIETRKSHSSLVALGNEATAGGIVFALAVLAMTVGLIRSETANDLRILTATGATARTRRALTASTTGVLALLAAVLGTAEAYAALAAFYRSDLHMLAQPPIADLVVILVALPAIAIAAGWLLAGREPSAIARRPLE